MRSNNPQDLSVFYCCAVSVYTVPFLHTRRYYRGVLYLHKVFVNISSLSRGPFLFGSVKTKYKV